MDVAKLTLNKGNLKRVYKNITGEQAKDKILGEIERQNFLKRLELKNDAFKKNDSYESYKDKMNNAYSNFMKKMIEQTGGNFKTEIPFKF